MNQSFKIAAMLGILLCVPSCNSTSSTPRGPAQTVSAPTTVPEPVKMISVTRWQCHDATQFQLRIMALDDLQFAQFIGQTAGSAAFRMILPQTPSGSGVRYSSDWASFFMKGAMGQLQSTASPLTPEIGPVECALVGK